MSTTIVTPKSHEIDYVKSIGFHPYIPGELVKIYDFSTGASKTIYTVPASKVLCISLLSFMVIADAGSCVGGFTMADATELFRFSHHVAAMALHPVPSIISFPIPYELEETDEISVTIVGAATSCRISVYGYLVDV